MASRPSATRRHRSSGPRTPPGKRQLIATMAMGSLSVEVVSAEAVRGSVAAPAVSDPKVSSAK